MQRMRQNTTLATAVLMSFAAAFAGCGGGSQTPPTGLAPATVAGPYNFVLTSGNGQAATNIYTNFTQIGTTLTGAANTLVCPSNDVSLCIGDSVTAIGTVSGTNVTIIVSFLSPAGADTMTMVGSATGTRLSGTYTDSLGDSGTWTGSAAIHPFGPPPSVYDYSGTFNSTSNPLPIAQTISLELGQDASSHASTNLTGKATIMNSPCVSSLTLTGQAIGDAFSLTDAASKISIMALPTLTMGNSFTYRYKFDPTAARCPGDSGRGVLTINSSPWDY